MLVSIWEFLEPEYHAKFDVKTGKVDKNINGFVKAITRKEAKGLSSYEVKEDEGKLSINI